MSTPERRHTSIAVSDPVCAAKILCELFGWRIYSEGPTPEEDRTIRVARKRHGLRSVRIRRRMMLLQTNRTLSENAPPNSTMLAYLPALRMPSPPGMAGIST